MPFYLGEPKDKEETSFKSDEGMVKIFIAGIPWRRIEESLDFIGTLVFLASDAYRKGDKNCL